MGVASTEMNVVANPDVPKTPRTDAKQNEVFAALEAKRVSPDEGLLLMIVHARALEVELAGRVVPPGEQV